MQYQCPKCNNLINEGEKFCPVCGQAVVLGTPNVNPVAMNPGAINPAIMNPGVMGPVSAPLLAMEDKIIHAVISALICIFMFIPKYVEQYIYYYGSSYYDDSFRELLYYSHEEFGYVILFALIVMFLLPIFFLFTMEKKPNRKSVLISTILSCVASALVLILTIVDYASSEVGYSGSSIHVKYCSFEIGFFIELILLIAIVVISILNLKGTPVSKLLKGKSASPTVPAMQPPVMQQPMPTMQQPMPAMQQPMPAMQQPTPAMQQPPVMQQPTPAMQQPTPAMQQPTPAMQQPPVMQQPMPNTTASATDVSATLVKYKELLDQGAITAEEFEIKKKELLNL